jgi:hypothetical protein
MKTRTSVTTVAGKETSVTHTEATLKEIIDAIGEERSAKIIVDYINRHQFLPAVRKAGDTVKDAEASKDAKADAEALLDRVAEGEVFDILEFIPNGRTSKPTKDDIANAKVFVSELDKGTFTVEQVDAAYGKLGMKFNGELDNYQMIEQHARYLQAKRKAAKAQVL